MDMEVFQKRLMASFIDCVLIGALVLILQMPFLVIFPWFVSYPAAIVLNIVGAILVLLKDGPYQVAFLDKQSLGKKQMFLRVTKDDGETPITWRDSINRNLPFALPFMVGIASYGVGFIPLPSVTKLLILPIVGIGSLVSLAVIGFEVFLMYKDPQGKRWGDRRAGTMVGPGDFS